MAGIGIPVGPDGAVDVTDRRVKNRDLRLRRYFASGMLKTLDKSEKTSLGTKKFNDECVNVWHLAAICFFVKHIVSDHEARQPCAQISNAVGPRIRLGREFHHERIALDDDFRPDWVPDQMIRKRYVERVASIRRSKARQPELAEWLGNIPRVIAERDQVLAAAGPVLRCYKRPLGEQAVSLAVSLDRRDTWLNPEDYHAHRYSSL